MDSEKRNCIALAGILIGWIEERRISNTCVYDLRSTRKESLIRYKEEEAMLKITGLDKLQKELKEAEQALDELDGELGVVNFDPHDPASIEAAVQSVMQMIDSRIQPYADNPVVGSLADQMKESYRENILQKAAEARLQPDGDE